MQVTFNITRGHTIALFKIITLGLLLGLGIQFLFAWTAPSGAAPTGNVAGPLTTGSPTQIKSGSLGLTGDLSVGTLGTLRNICLNGDCITAWPSGIGGAVPITTRCSGGSSLNCPIDLPPGDYRIVAYAAGHSDRFTGTSLVIDGVNVGSTANMGDPSGTSYIPNFGFRDVTGGRIVPVIFNIGGSMLDVQLLITAYSLNAGGGGGSGDNLGNHIATQNIDMDGAQVTDLGAPVNATDAATKGYVDGWIGGLGYGQTWQNMTASRSLDTAYQNLTGKPIVMAMDTQGVGGPSNFQVSIDNSTWVTVFRDGKIDGLVIPPNHFYRVSSGRGSVHFWSELR